MKYEVYAPDLGGSVVQKEVFIITGTLTTSTEMIES